MKGLVFFHYDTEDPHRTGYYLPSPNRPLEVEFVNNHWYQLYDYLGYWATSIEDEIPHNHQGTGYWHITDPQHQDYQPVASTSGITVQIPETSLTSDPALSPYVTAQPARSAESSSSGSSETRPRNTSSDEDLPRIQTPLEPLQEEVLVAQFRNVLDVREREPENPLTPDQPAYLNLVAEAVEFGLNVPAPPPLVQQPLAQNPFFLQNPLQPVIAQPINPVMAQAPAPETGRLRGEAPEYFNGNRSEADLFKRQFTIYRGLNANHEIMITPYARAMQFLSLIRGPRVDDWVGDQLQTLTDRATRAANPIAHGEPVHWTELMTAFDAAFTDTAKQQNAHIALQQLQMRKDDLDGYVATFKHLASRAGYPLTEAGTVHLFALGLKPGLLDAILYRDTQPTTFDQWVTAARTETQKFVHRQSFKNPGMMKYQWVKPSQPTDRRHPNDIPTPMDVDQPIFTQVRRIQQAPKGAQVRRAYTEADKNRLRAEGRCFFCENQGHMSNACPKKKSQNNQSSPQYKPKPHWQTNNRNQGFQKKPFGQPPPRTQGYRKYNNRTFKHAPQIRTARIEEIEEPEHQYEDEEPDVSSLAARTAKLSEAQREKWVQEMNDMGINF